MTSNSLLLRRDQTPFATGISRFADADQAFSGPGARILLRVAVSTVAEPFSAMMDTAAPWCIFEPGVAAGLRRVFFPFRENVVLSTRLGRFGGALYRGSITLVAEQGENLDVDATIFISPDWQGPSFLGYEGFLQRIRFAVDPENNLFYFGRI